MAIKRPLVNPVPRESIIERKKREASTAKDFISRDQLEFGVDSNRDKIRQFIGSIRSKLKKNLDVIEADQFWKSPSVPFMVVSSLTNILALFIGGIINFNRLPPEVQLFYDTVQGAWLPEDRIWHVLIIPIILTCLLLIQYRFVKIIFKQDRALSNGIAWIMTFLNVLLLIAISQIYSLNSV